MDAAEAFVALRSGAAYARQVRDVVIMTGPDAFTYLQGQLSQDLDVIPGSPGVWSFVLEPHGKVDAWVRVHRRAGDQFVLDVEAGMAGAVVDRLKRFLLRTNVEIDISHGWSLLAVRAAPPPDRAPPGWLVGMAPWPGAEGYDLIGPGDEVSLPDLGGDDRAEVSGDVLEWLRLACGVPRNGAELTADTIPAEAGQWVIDASVSFTKGCYTGQELVARIDARGGNVPRRLRGLLVDGADAPPTGATVTVDGEAVGEVTSAAVTPFGTLALAYVRRAIDPDAGAVVGAVEVEGSSCAAQICALPLLPELPRLPSSRLPSSRLPSSPLPPSA
jgi:folate-binding protein YgfZ